MTRFRSHQALFRLRVLALGLFALGLVLQPVLAAAGEMHELAHDPSGMHTHNLHAEDIDAELAAAGEQGQDEAKTLHVLLHFAHCCGVTTALLPALKPVGVVVGIAHPAIARALIPPQARLGSPFKPPIFV